MVHKEFRRVSFVAFYPSQEDYINIDEKIKPLIFDCDGVIYGEYVRDKILSEFYETKFIKKYDDYSDFWNEEIDPDTKLRTLLPERIDICFYSDIHKNEFIQKLSSMYDVVNESTEEKYDLTFDTYTVKKRIRIGMIDYNFKINIVVCVSLNKEEPPFCDLDFIVNGFIMSQNQYYLSRSTGTFIDHLNFSDHIKLSAKIVDMIVERKTLCFTLDINSIANILKSDYTVANLKGITFGNYCEESCIICLNKNAAKCKTNLSYFCKNCMGDFLINSKKVEITEIDHKRYVECIYIKTPMQTKHKIYRCDILNELDDLEKFQL